MIREEKLVSPQEKNHYSIIPHAVDFFLLILTLQDNSRVSFSCSSCREWTGLHVQQAYRVTVSGTTNLCMYIWSALSVEY